MESGRSGCGTREELVASIRRLVSAVLDRLEEGSREKTLDLGVDEALGKYCSEGVAALA